MKKLCLAAGIFLFASQVFAEPVALTDSQMDQVTAGGVEKVDGFVCPVIKTDGVLNSPKGAALPTGYYTIGATNVSVPIHATNDDGAGSPGGPHAAPGSTTYTAIWNVSQ
jgi:hypothetical protein